MCASEYKPQIETRRQDESAGERAGGVKRRSICPVYVQSCTIQEHLMARQSLDRFGPSELTLLAHVRGVGPPHLGMLCSLHDVTSWSQPLSI